MVLIPDTALSFLYKILKSYKPDIVVGHSAIVSAYFRIVGILFPKIKKVIVLHAADYEGSGRLQKAEYLLQYVSDWSADTYKNRCHAKLSIMELN